MISAMCLIIGVASLTAQTATPAPSAPSPSGDSLKLQQTVKTVYDIGVAGYAWLTDEVGDDPNLEDGRSIAAFDGATIDWSKCTTISHSDLVKLLVPYRISEVPSVDAWGNPLEFCVSHENLLRNSYVIGVRSSGRDGRFENKPYVRGSFDPSDLDHDIVWLDGFFVAWPKDLAP